MTRLIEHIHKEIVKESLKNDLDAEKLLALTTAYQELKKYCWDYSVEELDIPKLLELDYEIILCIGESDSLSLTSIYTHLHRTKSTVSYRIERLIENDILARRPTVFKNKPIYLTDKGKEVLSMIRKEV